MKTLSFDDSLITDEMIRKMATEMAKGIVVSDPFPDPKPMTRREHKRDGARAHALAERLKKILTGMAELKAFEHLKDQTVKMRPGTDKVRMVHDAGHGQRSVLNSTFEEFIENMIGALEKADQSGLYGEKIVDFAEDHAKDMRTANTLGHEIQDGSILITLLYKGGEFETSVAQDTYSDAPSLGDKVNEEEEDEDFLDDLDLIE